MSPERNPILSDSISDSALLDAYRTSGGSRSALETLLTRHEGRLFATCMRMVGDRETARDLAQETLVRVIGAIDSFDGRAQFTTWMTRIAMNCCISHLRKEKHRRAASLEASVGGASSLRERLESTEPEPARGVQHDEDLQRLTLAMLQLTPDQRAVLVLRDVHGAAERDIARTLNIAAGTVKSRLFRARSALRAAMVELENPGESPERKQN